MAATPRQLQAITRHDVSMVVTAGAGTGKTFVLVEKYLNLLTRFNYHIGDILALTFTEKAAAEMKERIREKVIQCLRDDPDNQVWKTAYDELVMAPIMTFHSFCAHILREFAIEAGIDPGFVILDEAAALAIEREAFEALIRDPSDAIREPLVRLLAQVERYHLHQILLFLSQHIESFILFAQDLERDPEGIITNWEVFLEKTRAPVLKEFFTNSDVCDAISDIIRFERMYTNEDDTAVRYIKNILPYLRELTADASPEQLHAAAKNILAIKRSGNLGSQKKWKKEDLARFRQAKTYLIKSLERIVPYFSLYIERDSPFTAATIAFFKDLTVVAQEYFETFSRLKQQQNGLDFHDLISLTNDFLRKNEPIVHRHIRPRYQYILIDEFQDTDPAQFDIITAIIGELTPKNRSLFIVGDPKQSIYLFRNADVTRFKEAQERILSDCNGDCINLDISFRSSHAVTSCVNLLFSHIFASPEKPWEFGYEPIHVCDERQSSPGSVMILLPKKAPKGSVRSETKEREAAMVANTIKRIVSSDSFVITDKNGMTRKAKYEDIAILLERRTFLSTYTAALLREEIPFYVHGGIGFYSRQEIYDLYNILSFLVRPFDSAALFGALRSPYFSLSDAVLYHIHHLPQAGQDWSLYKKLNICAEICKSQSSQEIEGIGIHSSSDRDLIIRASALLASWKKITHRDSVISLIRRVIHDSQILTIYGALDDGAQQVANLNKLMGIVRKRSEGAYYSLSDLVEDLTVSITDEEREGEAALEALSQTSVNIMTVHAAKGLEFPIVILPDMGYTREGDLGTVLFGDHTSLFGVKIPDPSHEYEMRETPVYTALSLIQREKENAERKRLFYVGATRARDHLILCGTLPEKGFESLEDGKSRIDWVCTVFGITPEVAEEGGKITIDLDDGQLPLEIMVMTDSDEEFLEKERHEPPMLTLPKTFASQYGTRSQRPSHVQRKGEYNRPIPVTDLIRLENCPDLAEEEGGLITIPDAGDLHRDEVGTLIHQFFSGKNPKIVLSSYGIESPAALEFCSTLYEHFCNTPLICDARRSYQEVPFVISLGDFSITGRIDRIIQDQNNDWYVIDYKSGTCRGADLQMNIYRIAAESLVQKPVGMYIYSLRTETFMRPRCISETEIRDHVKRYCDGELAQRP